MLYNFIEHSGVAHDEDPPGRGSGRYGWGTGDNPRQHQFDFISEVDKMRKKGIKDREIAKALLGDRASSSDLTAELSIAKSEKRKALRERALKLLDENDGNKSEVGRIMGINESSVRSLLDPVLAERADRYQNTANMLKRVVDEKGTVDVGKDAILHWGINDSTKKVAISILEKQGYVTAKVKVPQLSNPSNETWVLTLSKPGTTYGEIQKNKFNIQSVVDYTPDEGKTWFVPEFPKSMDSKRVLIKYAEEGGTSKDGVVELRKGVDDISLGDSMYAQVRIAVDDKYYMKGMAIYSDDIPKGYDIIYNTNKKIGTPKEEVFKKLKVNSETGEIDKDNPFGAAIMAGGQRHYTDKNGKDQLSVINKVSEEGKWDSWSRNLSSQFLGKQPLKIINQQLDISIAGKRNELDEIRRLTNPVIRKKMYEDFADGCDANAADLSARGFKNQAFQVLLPIPELKSNEIYAPNYNDGDKVALVRYPHGGTFEIPILTVNNKHEKAKSIMGGAKDAVGINQEVADRLSGADFDGDTAAVIPLRSNRLSIVSTDRPKELTDFDPKALYKLPDSAPDIKDSTKQLQMGQVSNLITDMTIGGATEDEIVRAVKHSMVVIDSVKHRLDYKQSYIDNNIYDLKKTYQGVNERGQVKGASTILSRAKATAWTDEFKEITDVKKMTPEELKRWNEGKKVLRPTGKLKKVQITDPKKMTEEELAIYNSGKKVYRNSEERVQTKVKNMDLVDDAFDLVRDKNNPKEAAYANYANNLKRLAEEARKEMRAINPEKVNQSARKTYQKEVDSLNEKLRIAKLNSPKERVAQAIGNQKASERINDNPDLDYEHRQRIRAEELNRARAFVGAGKERIEITDKEWEAIQANAISTNKLTEILKNTDQEAFKKRATPKEVRGLTDAQIAFAKTLSASGMYTQKEIAERFGVSPSTVSKAISS